MLLQQPIYIQMPVMYAVQGLIIMASYSYDPLKSSTTITDNDKKKWTYYFDIFMNTIQIQDPEGRSTYTEFDYRDITTYYGDVTATIDRNGNRTEYIVDNNSETSKNDANNTGKNTGKTLKTTYPDGGITTCKYDADGINLIEEVNQMGSHTYYKYDSNGNLLKKVQPLDGTKAYVEGNTTDFAVTVYTYFTNGLIKSEIDPEGNKVEYTYDQYGSVATKKDAAGNTTYTYDILGQKRTETTDVGNKTEWVYNKNGQVIKQINPDGGINRTTYDDSGYVVLEVKPNQYDITKDSNSVYTGTIGMHSEWDSRGYLISTTDELSNKTQYEWDAYGNKTKEIKPDGATYLYTYDALNRLIKTEIIDGTSGKVEINTVSYSILYNNNSQITTTAYANSNLSSTMVTVKDYADREVEVQYGDYSRTSTIYNLDGTIKQKTAANGAITTYGYDKLSNFINEWKPVSVEGGTT